MKRIHLLILLVVLSMLLIALPAEAQRVMSLKMGKGQALVNSLTGSAQILPAGKREWRSLAAKQYLRGGDEVVTGSKARLELILPDNSKVRFADNSRFRIVQLDTGTASRNVRINVAVGRTWANVSKIFGGKSRFEVSCENAVAGVRGTIYRVNVSDDKSAVVKVYDGEVAVSGGGDRPATQEAGKPPVLGVPTKVSGPTKVAGPKKITMEEWVYLIRSMQQINISSTGVPDKPRSFTEQEDRDEWVDWNKARDAEQ
jgi:ferric-dicitrate binding protein FerR (iron transport regulator)